MGVPSFLTQAISSWLLAGPRPRSSGDLKSASQTKASPPRNTSTHAMQKVGAHPISVLLPRSCQGAYWGQGGILWSPSCLSWGPGTFSPPSRSLPCLDSSEILGLFPPLMSPAQTKDFPFLGHSKQSKRQQMQTLLPGVCLAMMDMFNPPSKYVLMHIPGKVCPTL